MITITKWAQSAITKGDQGTLTSASSTEPAHPTYHTHTQCIAKALRLAAVA